MNFGWNVNTALSVLPVLAASVGAICILRINWKQYGLLFFFSGIVGLVLCYILIGLKIYTFPFRLFPSFTSIPIPTLLIVFPAYVVAAVRYSPKSWGWKIPYYWVLVHLVALIEGLSEGMSDIIHYGEHWTLFDSYALWWIYLLVFEWLGGLMVSPENRKPLDPSYLRHGTIGWFVVHFVLIVSFFLAGVYVGSTLLK